MKLAILTSCSRNAGGLFYSVRGLSKSLADGDCEPAIYSPEDEYSAEDAGVWAPLPVRTYSSWGPLDSSAGLRRLLRSDQPDLLHVHGIWKDNQWAAYQYQKKTGTPVVVSPRGMLDPWALRNSAWKKKIAGFLFTNKALEHASCIHALCRSELDSIRALGLTNPVSLLPNGVDLPDIASSPKTRAGGKQLLFLGRIHPKKGISELLRAWAEVGGDWKLVIAGWDDGGHEAGLRDLAESLGIMGSVEFVGAQFGAAKDHLLRQVDAFILPSFSEGLPMSVLEACAYGLPVLISDYCNLPEAFESNAAYRVNPDPSSLTAGLSRLFSSSEEQLRRMGMNGRYMIEKDFAWGRIADQMNRVYEWCLNGGTPPACVVY